MTMQDLAIQYLGTRQGDKRHKEIIDTYNQIRPLPRGYRMKYTDSWCMAFVSFLEYRCNVVNPIYECSCYYALQGFKQAKQTVKKSDVMVGDIIYYDWGNNGTIDHTGIITAVNSDTYDVIEGNYSKQVKIRKISKKSKEIEGFARVSYPIEEKKSDTDVDIDDLALAVIRGQYGTGKVRKAKLGELYDVVQTRVNELLKGGK